MELTKNFEHSPAESKWYNHWLEKKYFKSTPDGREPYTIVIPPPNVTGVLHMGHCLNNTIQDILIRRARMQGKNACWVPGTDHASIATEAKVVQMLREKGINKSSLSREEFLKYAWEWKDRYGGIILQQLKKLGCSLDWDRTTFTMDPDYYDSVINVFIDLYNKGYIYRGKRMINWDPKAKTALSDEEVIRKEVQSKLYYIRYALEESQKSKIKSQKSETDSQLTTHDSPLTTHDYITIATVRPETILGDTAIAVNPKDERYKNFHGKFAFVPLINRRIPIIADEYVEMDFGTGALKITPAHDKNDYQIGEKHGLEIIDIMNDDGTMSEDAELYIGEDRFEVRKKIVKELEAKGHLVKIEDYTNQIGFSERTDVAVEDRLSLQWWVDMKKLYRPALEAVINDEIKFYPARFKNLYRNWMENIRDWCISRQLWWGHRIPAWYDDNGRFVVAKTEEDAKKLFSKGVISDNDQYSISDAKLKQDEDVLDTWFSAWLWPIEVFKGYSHPGNADIKYYYPTNTLVTAPEIIFFWVARMIMAGFEYMKDTFPGEPKKWKPFHDVYFTGIVRDELGRKMSKQLGNSPDLLGLIDKYGADAVRFGIMISSPAANDLLFNVKEESTLKQGSFFINKIWNALKLVKIWEAKQAASHEPRAAGFAVEWFENRLNQAKSEIEESYKDFRLSEILKTIYSLIWDDFCSWYLEWVKPGFEEPIDANIYNKTVDFFEELMQLLHPFMPFITEEIYHELKGRKDGDDITIKKIKPIEIIDEDISRLGEDLKLLLSDSRDFKKNNDIRINESIRRLTLPKIIFGNDSSIYRIIKKQLNIEDLSFTEEETEEMDDKIERTPSTEIEKNITEPKMSSSVTTTTTIAPFKDYQIKYETEQRIDKVKRKEELEKELEYITGFLSSVEKKLSNERFIKNAKPEVVETERKKKADAEANIKTIKKSLGNL